MKSIAFINQKGGVGKTTSAINLGYFLSTKGKKVLLVDADPQGNLSSVFKLKGDNIKNNTIYECYMHDKKLSECIFNTDIDNIDVVPADINLADADYFLSGSGEEGMLVLRKSFDDSNLKKYDYIICDCSPSLGFLTSNVMVACKQIIIPLEACEFSLDGIDNILKILNNVVEINEDLEVLGVLLTRVEKITRLAKDYIDELEPIFGDKVFKTIIHKNVKISEANKYKQPVGLYSPKSKGSLEYASFAEEVLNLE